MSPRELEQLIQNAFDGEDVDSAALRDSLLSDPTALDAWCDYAILDAELRRHARGRLKVPGTVPAREEVVRRTRHRRQIWASGLAAAAVIVLAAVSLRLFVAQHRNPDAELACSPGSVITGTGGESVVGGPLEKNMPLRLSQGVAKLSLGNGVEAVIEGPARFSITGDNSLSIEGGHSWFRVPAGAEGFTVTSSGLQVVDLGTEFCLDLREDQPASVHVLDGRVEISARGGSRETAQVDAGRAMALQPNGRWLPLPSVSPHFRKELPPALPVLEIDFEEIRGDRLDMGGDILGATGASAILKGKSGARLVPGIDGLALELDGISAWLESDWPGISGTAPRTVSLWCRIPRNARHLATPPLVLWGNPITGWNRKFKVAPLTREDGKTVLRASFGNYLVDGETPIADGEWHHLAVVYRGNGPEGDPDVSLYVDGREESVTRKGAGSGEIRTDTDISRGMTLGRYELDARGRNPHLRATIDRYRIFAGSLGHEEIRRLAEKR